MRLGRWLLMAMPVLAMQAPAAPARDSCILVKTQIETLQQVRDKRGRTALQLSPADTLTPGTEAIYTLSATNICDAAEQSVTIATAVPPHLIYVAGTATGPGTDVTFSVDGGFNFSRPEALRAKNAEGVLRKAEPRDYTHIRWIMRKSLEPGAVAYMRYRALFE